MVYIALNTFLTLVELPKSFISNGCEVTWTAILLHGKCYIQGGLEKLVLEREDSPKRPKTIRKEQRRRLLDVKSRLRNGDSRIYLR